MTATEMYKLLISAGYDVSTVERFSKPFECFNISCNAIGQVVVENLHFSLELLAWAYTDYLGIKRFSRQLLYDLPILRYNNPIHTCMRVLLAEGRTERTYTGSSDSPLLPGRRKSLEPGWDILACAIGIPIAEINEEKGLLRIPRQVYIFRAV